MHERSSFAALFGSRKVDNSWIAAVPRLPVEMQLPENLTF
jgi:hypothetical protein